MFREISLISEERGEVTGDNAEADAHKRIHHELRLAHPARTVGS